MSLLPHQNPAQYSKLVTQIATAVSTSIGAADSIVSNDGMLDVSPDITNEKLVEAIVKLGEFDKRNIHQQCLVRYGVGRMILELCARTSRLETEVIEDEGLPEKMGIGAKAILNWVQVAKAIPPNMVKPGLSWNCLTNAIVRLPEDPIQILAIRAAQDQALEEASANPVECTGAVVRKKVHEAMEGMGLKPPAPPDKFALLLEYALLLRRLRHLDETMDGSVDRIDLVNAIEEKEASLINLQVISATV